MAIPVIKKKPGEKFPIGLRYRDPDLPTGVTISTVSCSVSPVTNLVLGTQGTLASGTEAYCWITGGTTLVDYTVTFTCTLSDTKILIDKYLVKVRA